MLGMVKFEYYQVYFYPTEESYHAFSLVSSYSQYFFWLFLLLQKKIKVKLALATQTGDLTTLTDEMMQNPLLVALKTIKILSM